MAKRPLRVLQVVDNLGVGGAETWLMELLTHWSSTGAVEMDILACSGREGAFDDQARALGAQVHYLRYGRDRLPQFAGEYRRLLRDRQYDAVHDHQDYASGWHFLAAGGRLPAVKVSHVHNPWIHISANYGVTPQRRLTAMLGRRLVNLMASHVCGTSEYVLRRYGFQEGESGRPKTVVAHCGFDVARYCAAREPARRSVFEEFGFADDTKLVLFAGRLDQDLELGHPRNHKNSWLAVLIAREAARNDERVRLLMAGAGDRQRAEIEAQIAGWGLGDRLRLIGVRDDIARLMRASDVLLFPSAEEGLGMVAVEAQAAGLPVLASAAVPHDAVVIPELFEAMSLDAPASAWAAALLSLAERPRKTPNFCKTAMEASAYSIATSAARLEAIYRDAG